MDRHVWQLIYQTIRKVDRAVERMGRKPRAFSDVKIVAMYLWTVWHDRPLRWGCNKSHYTGYFRPYKLPSVSQFCRRVKTDRCQMILLGVHQTLTRRNHPLKLSFMDGRAMEVGPHSKDREATRGWGRGRMAKGYKLHAWATEDGYVPFWSVMPLNVDEKTVASELIQHAQPQEIVLADKQYDSGALYDQVAVTGGQLITPLPKNAGCGHRPQSPSRLLVAHAWQGLIRFIYRQRLTIERIFGYQASYGGGLGPLPTWVRTLDRARRWIGAKIIIHHARLRLNEAVK